MAFECLLNSFSLNLLCKVDIDMFSSLARSFKVVLLDGGICMMAAGKTKSFYG
jgi:hypothetical protein